MIDPVRYTTSIETIEPDEPETIRALEKQLHNILETTSRDYGHAVRAVHAKGHGIAHGTLTVPDTLPSELAQGLFAGPGTYDAIIRLSTNAGDILDDAISLPRGLALKIMGVEGERLQGTEDEETQDFALVNSPTFAASDAKKFLANLSLLAKTTDKAEGAKKAISAVMRAFEAALETVGGESAMLSTLGGAKPVHPLGATYFSQTAFRFGDFVGKFRLAPISGIKEFADETVNASGRPDAIRQSVNELLIEQGGIWELGVQLCTDLQAMPIEDPTVARDEEVSPYRRVATLEIPAQQAWIDGASDAEEDRLFFSPWHGLAAHQPLGGINRARRDPYRMSGQFRAQVNGCPFAEPRAQTDQEGGS